MLVAGEVDHPRQFLRTALAWIDVMPDMLVDTERRDAIEPGFVRGEAHEFGLDGAPHGLPRCSELTGEPSDGRVLAS